MLIGFVTRLFFMAMPLLQQLARAEMFVIRSLMGYFSSAWLKLNSLLVWSTSVGMSHVQSHLPATKYQCRIRPFYIRPMLTVAFSSLFPVEDILFRQQAIKHFAESCVGLFSRLLHHIFILCKPWIVVGYCWLTVTISLNLKLYRIDGYSMQTSLMAYLCWGAESVAYLQLNSLEALRHSLEIVILIACLYIVVVSFTVIAYT